jgi:citrate lyase subunit beta/citryl-CoA lyase
VSDVDLSAARSFLIRPGTDAATLTSGLQSAAHAVIADLEDLVPADQKSTARDTVRELFAAPSRASKLVRINAPDTEEFAADRTLLDEIELDGVIVPKASPAMLGMLGGLTLPVLALIETAEGVREAFETARLPTVVALIIAPGDLSKALQIEIRPDGQSLLYTRSKLVVDSAAAGIRPPIDIPARSEGDELRAEVAYARSLGLWGKLCLQVAQAATINEAFG